MYLLITVIKYRGVVYLVDIKELQRKRFIYFLVYYGADVLIISASFILV